MTPNISGTAKTRIGKFCMQTNNPLKGRGQSHMTRFFFKFCPYHIFVVGKARHFKFRVLIGAKAYECMHDILIPKVMCLESRDLFIFWEISDNISEMLQDRDIVAMKANRKSYVAYRMAPLPVPLKVTFAD